MTTLNEQEREALGRALTTVDTVTIVDPGGPLATAVEAILTARLTLVEAKARSGAWDEAVQAVAWAQDNGPAEDALRYVADHNPYRAAASSHPTGNQP